MANNFKSKVKQPWTTYDNGLVQHRGIFKNATQKMCYMYLVSFSNANKIFPSMEAIAEAICSTKKTATTIIQQLEELGLIEVERTPGLSNIYTLNDYFEVVEAMETEETTSEKITPVKKLHQTSEKITPPPVKKLHSKTKTIKLKSKNKISSSPDSQFSIDNELKEKYHNAPFEEIKAELLNDETATINTDKQYKSMLEYRLKNWKPKQSNKPSGKQKKPTRTELLPDWFDKGLVQGEPDFPNADQEAKKKEIDDMLKKLREGEN